MPGRTQPFNLRPKTKHDPLPQEALDHFWHPNRPGVEQAPADVRKMLAEIHPKLRCVRPPAGAPMHHGYHPWIVWFEYPETTHPLCPGWKLVLVWRNPDTMEPLPLDGRLYGNLYMIHPKMFRSAVAYFDTCVAQLAREDKARKEFSRNRSYDMTKELEDSRKIKNIGHGSKFAMHHDGTNIAGRGDIDWATATMYDRLPPEIRRRAEEQEGKRTRGQVSNSRASGTIESTREWQADMARQMDMLRLMHDRRQLVTIRRSRASVGYTGR